MMFFILDLGLEKNRIIYFIKKDNIHYNIISIVNSTSACPQAMDNGSPISWERCLAFEFVDIYIQ